MKTLNAKTAFAALAAVAAVTAVAAPAAAQPYERYGEGRYERDHWDRGGQRLDQRWEQLDHRIERGLRRGGLTPREAARMRAQAREIARIESRYRIDGLSRWERADLNQRFDRLEAQIQAQAHDGDRRYGAGYGYDRR